MAHDVFISYSSEDKLTADAVCATLEARHIRCWIAPRDVLPGRNYAEMLVEAIHGAGLMVLVFSSKSNSSLHVVREVERAASTGIPILPLRIEDVPLSASMEYYISSTHWLDAITPPLERHLKQLADTVELLLARTGKTAMVAEEPDAPRALPLAEVATAAKTRKAPLSKDAVASAKPWYRSRLALLASGVGAIAVVTAIALVTVLAGGGEEGTTDGETSVARTVIPTTTETASPTTSTSLTTSTIAPTTTVSTIVSPNAWTNLNPTGDLPSARSGHSMVYDSVRDKVVLFGGESGKAGGESSRTWYKDTWGYDFDTNAWTDLTPVGDVPSARCWVSMVYDSDTGKVILFGGQDGTNGFNDTWAYEPAADSWSPLNPDGSLPSARGGHSMVYDPATGEVILFGGWDGASCLNDTWAYDPSANTWTKFKPVGDAPCMRYGHSMVYDPATGKVILFGGWDGASCLNDTWAYDPSANTWTKFKPVGDAPCMRYGHSMVYDPATGKVILFGGRDGTRYLNDTWACDPVANTWTDLDPAGDVPPARQLPAMAYDPGTGKAVLFGGWGGSYALEDTWAYTPTATTVSTTTTVPSTSSTKIKQPTTTWRPATTTTWRPATTTTRASIPSTTTTGSTTTTLEPSASSSSTTLGPG